MTARQRLSGVSFAASPGSVTALVGPNGAGKTTLMRCLAGLEVPDAGSVTLAGIDVVADPRAARSRMGFLQDFFGLYDRLSVRRCLDYAARSRLVAPADRPGRIDAVAASLGLGDLLDRPAAALSRGQRQRVAIGTAIIHRPPVLILDEPAAGLDPEARAELAGLLRSLAADGMTLLVSSHILAELEDYSTDVLMLERGQVIGHGPLIAAEHRLAITLAGGDDYERKSQPSSQGSRTCRGSLLRARRSASALPATGRHRRHWPARLVSAGHAIALFEERQSSMQDHLARLRVAREAA